MSKRSANLIEAAINFAARFGFITKEVFFEYTCSNAKSQQYTYWKNLTKSGCFYPSLNQPGVCHLSRKGRSLAQYPAVLSKSLFTMSHDLIVAKTLLELEQSSLVLESWTESELARDHYTACDILGVNRIDKLPDLVVDLKGISKTIRVAFEVESSLKSKERYQRISINYLSMENIDLVVYCCGNSVIRNAVKRAFSESIFNQNKKTPITYLTQGFEKNKFDAIAQTVNLQIPLKEILLSALNLPNSAWQIKVEKNRNRFRRLKTNKITENLNNSKQDQDLESVRPSPGPLASFRDHPLPTNTLREGGHEPGAGVGRGPEKIRNIELE